MKSAGRNELLTLEETAALIREGEVLSIAGAEALLDRLPAGAWVGGTSHYFLTNEGAIKTAEKIFVTRLPAGLTAKIEYYPAGTLHRLVDEAPDNGFSLVVIPTASDALQQFSEQGRFWHDIFLKPVIGWVSGIDLEQLGRQRAAIYHGPSKRRLRDGAVVMQVSLPDDLLAAIEAVNIFEPDRRYVLRFPRTASSVTDCTVNGQPRRLADFLVEQGNGEGRLPMIGNFAGARVNVSCQSIDVTNGRVQLYAPVFPDVEYFLARPLSDYVAHLAGEMDKRGGRDVWFSCVCVRNYLHGELEGRRTGSLQGPGSFGEIAYQLHNQTLVALTIG